MNSGQKHILPEEKARQHIDKQLHDAGWRVVLRSEYEANQEAQALCEAPTEQHHRADYILFLNDFAVGVIEAKRGDIELATTNHILQVEYYARCEKELFRCFHKPLPFVWLANGKEILFRDLGDPNSEYMPCDRFLTPKEIARRLDIRDMWVGLPELRRDGLRKCQYEGIRNLESAFRQGRKRALMVLATGAGKTFLACTAAYRFLTYTPMHSILFLVDRNNLGKQAEDDFSNYHLTENGDAFNTIYEVERLRNHRIPKDAQVVIATIQGLYAYLNGQEVDESDNEESDDEESGSHGVGDNPALPHNYFDLIIIDECHRSIYNSWKQVLLYFDTARLIGLTATPGPETLAFFDDNVVINYSLDQSIADKVNVDFLPYRIRTDATENGGTIAAEEEVDVITNYTGAEKRIRMEKARGYSPEELNRSVINPAQIRTILTAYRDNVYQDLFPDRKDEDFKYLPKTLIYALNDAHATLITAIAREVFHKENDPCYVQKITYSAGNSNKLIQSFRTDRNFRIAVTVTLVATGTDVKPLEVVMFMRDVQSEQLYNQMVGRGVRTIDDDQLRAVTPNATSKTLFYVIDAVGVTEHAKQMRPVAMEPGHTLPTLAQVLEEITHGIVSDLNLRILSARMARIDDRAEEKQQARFAELAGQTMQQIYTAVYHAMERGLPPYINIDGDNQLRLDLVTSLRNHAEAREYLLKLNAGFTTVLRPGSDRLIDAGFSQHDAHELTLAFETYVSTHRDDIEALRIIYQNQNAPITRMMLEQLRDRLLEANSHFATTRLWGSYALLHPEAVTVLTNKNEKDMLTNIIQLVRYAYHAISRLAPLSSRANSLFNLWCGKLQGKHPKGLSEEQVRIFAQVKDYVVANGSADIKLFSNYNRESAVKLILSFKTADGRKQANDYITSLSQFILYNQNNATA